MDPKEYETMFALEDRHWWHVGMQRITTTLLAHLYPPGADLCILDAGCGTGAAMRYLSAYGSVTGCDLSDLALGFCRQRGLVRLAQSTVMSLPFCDRFFDLVVSLDVLYHRDVGDYHHALREFHRVLKSGGRLFLRLPAYNWLRGRHDVAIHTSRRFTAPELHQALTTAGFAVEKASYANTLLFPIALGKRLLERAVRPGNGSDVHANPSWQDAFLARFLFAEARWLAHHSLPFGLSVVMIGRKE
jgi:SAM-dependent methyltransferase